MTRLWRATLRLPGACILAVLLAAVTMALVCFCMPRLTGPVSIMFGFIRAPRLGAVLVLIRRCGNSIVRGLVFAVRAFAALLGTCRGVVFLSAWLAGRCGLLGPARLTHCVVWFAAAAICRPCGGPAVAGALRFWFTSSPPLAAGLASTCLAQIIVLINALPSRCTERR